MHVLLQCKIIINLYYYFLQLYFLIFYTCYSKIYKVLKLILNYLIL